MDNESAEVELMALADCGVGGPRMSAATDADRPGSRSRGRSPPGPDIGRSDQTPRLRWG